MSHIEVIHNALPEDQYEFVKEVFEDKHCQHGTCWIQNFGIAERDTEHCNLDHYMFCHTGYVEGYQPTPAFTKVEPYITRLLNVRRYLRFKANFYPRTKTIDKHPWHCDEFRKVTGLDVKTALLSLNTCNGYTAFEDGTKVPSTDNTLILNPTDVRHMGTSTSNANYRINLNINYIC
tara:strand:- start:702 stop:1232 length:531 start_codon:yes stop_codon:yes gene_type:complete